jgi:hydroxyacylglutathione hydrolase
LPLLDTESQPWWFTFLGASGGRTLLGVELNCGEIGIILIHSGNSNISKEQIRQPDLIYLGHSVYAELKGVRGYPVLTIINIDTEKLGDRSYISHDGTTAVVIDPQRDINRVQAILDREELTLGAVLETHIHNDYVSGGLQLAKEHNVQYLVNQSDLVSYARFGVQDNQIFPVGSFALKALLTPGHTYTHMSYVLLDAQQKAHGVFTGGSMLHGSTGRPDLLGATHAFELAGLQHGSVRQIAELLEDKISIYPTHGFGSFCSATPTSGDASTIADERKANPALILEKAEFVALTLAALDSFPSYFKYMAPINLAGPSPIDLSALESMLSEEIIQAMIAGSWVADLRTRTSWTSAHVPGSLSFGLDGSFASYVGWLLPHEGKLILLSDQTSDIDQAQIELARIGIDHPEGSYVGDFSSFQPLNHTRTVTFKELPQAVKEKLVTVLDVRSNSERAASHIAPSIHINLHELASRVAELPRDREIWVHCASAYRATMAVGILEKLEIKAVLINEAYEACLEVAGIEIVTGRYDSGLAELSH